MYKYELLVIPSPLGLLKVYVYGFLERGSRGKVYASLNDVTVSSTGYNKKRTIVKTVGDLYKSMTGKE